TGEPKLLLEAEGKPCPSWASQAWRDDAGYALRRYIRHVRSSPYADRVLGYHVASGTTEEWMYWGANEGRFCDYSPVARQAFRRWLRDRYGSDAALQAAWGRADVTLDTADVPTFARRSATEHFAFRDPTAARDVIDLHLFLANITTEAIRALARVVKDETDGQALMGTFYGYVLQLVGEQRQQNAGHLDLMGVLDCPDIDFVTSPTSYAFRTLGDGYSHFMSLLDSVKLHGKLWFDENDIRTWLVDAPAGQWGRYDTFEDSLRMQQREFANVIGNGCGMWWFDMGGGWYDDERMLAAIERMRAIADETVHWDRSPVAEVAMVVDDASLAAMQTGNAISWPLLMQQMLELGRIGAPIATYALADIGAMPDMKLYLFANAFAPTEDQVEAIRRKVRRNGAWAVWIYAPGVVDGGQLRPEAAERLTGFRLGMVDEQAPLTVSLTADGHAATGLRDMTYGPATAFGPVFFADDPDIEAWGTLGANAKCGLAARRFHAWTSVYSAAPALPTALLRRLAAAAGVHLYADAGDAVYANRSVLAVAFGSPGEKVIRLPHPATVTDLMTRQRIPAGAAGFAVTVPDVSARIWRLE
ncbi:MAG TPA: beta-galactosidase, partial [Armatimonadota bacterium]|nr:beta-galactosidase [Armatimonadota bacterium]